jgi:tetratricopeptide (TPR) repeat protein
VVASAVACSGTATSLEEPDGLHPVPLPDASQLSTTQKAFYDEALAGLALHDVATPPAELSVAYGELGKRFLADGFAEAAEPCFANAVELDPERFDWIYYLAHVDRGSGRGESAIGRFERALELRPDDVAAWVWLGNTLFQSASYERSRAAFEKALELHPESAATHLGLGRVALAERRYEDAVQALTLTLDLSPGATIAHYPLAQAYRGLGQVEIAQQHLELRGETEAYPRDPLMDEIRTRFGSPSVTTDRAGNAFAQRDFARAVIEFQKVLEIAPDVAMSHANMAAALFQQGDRAAATAEFERALELDPTDPAVLFSLGAMSYHAGKLDAELRYYERALEQQANYVPAHLELAHVLRGRGEHARAVVHYRVVLAAEPRSADARLGLVMALVRLERWPAVVEALVAAIEALPDQPAFVHALARVRAASPDVAVRDGGRALELLGRLVQGGQQSTDVGETIAMAMAALGQFDQAILYQTQTIDVVRQAGQSELLDTMNARLRAYRESRAWLTPWPDDDPLHERPPSISPAPPRRGGFDS